MTFQISSPAFQPNAEIPKPFTCDGPDVSPELRWTDPPAGTLAFALIADDPDAPMGTWVHWVIYDLPGTARSLPQGVPKDENLKDGSRQGRNDFGRSGYGGPCPPPGAAHRYFFKLYALSAKTGLKPGAAKADLLKAMQGKTLSQTEVVGKYKR
jgi:Raf kinase inhibitor-like YbhB/YbcL family protein